MPAARQFFAGAYKFHLMQAKRLSNRKLPLQWKWECVPNGKKPNVVLTNDDGYQAAGLRALAEDLKDFANVRIVAPSWERSGAAQSLTLAPADRLPQNCRERMGHRRHSRRLRHRRAPWPASGAPDLVISGINHGANLGENVYYSGTVGAAREAVIHHVPGLALSLCSKRVNSDFAPTAQLARQIAELMLREKLPDQVLLNVNVPENWQGGVKLTRQSKKITRTLLREGEDPKGSRYFWLSEQRVDREMEIDADSDYAAIFAGEASVTPLHLDPTHTNAQSPVPLGGLVIAAPVAPRLQTGIFSCSEIPNVFRPLTQ